MADQWLRAAKALEILTRDSGYYDSVRSLCSRAHQGLIRSRAQLLVVGEEKRNSVEVPASFWWAGGEDALEQDWDRGDFSTWIERKVQWRAFGVEFDVDGFKLMLPTEVGSKIARELSTSNNPEWVTAIAARKQLYMSNFASPTSADQVLLDQCRLGLVTGRALRMERTMEKFQGSQRIEAREWDIPDWFWNEFTKSGSSSQDWNRGVFRGQGRSQDGLADIVLTGVYFLKDTLPNQNDKNEEATSSPTKGAKGRPPKAFWDDLWCAVWGSVYRGDFEPKSQGEIERAMLDWISEHDHEAAESTVKPAARKMLAELGKK